MEASKREQAISAAGRELEQALDLVDSSDTLARWMVYRLAELRRAVEEAADPEQRRAAQSEQDRLVIALWAHRDNLPGRVGLERRLSQALELLETLVAQQEAWRPRRAPPQGPIEKIGVLKSQVDGLIRLAAVLLYKRDMALNEPSDPALPLGEEEAGLQKQLAELSELMLRGLRVRAEPRATGAISEAQAMKLMEGEIVRDLDALSETLISLRDDLVSGGGTSGRPS
jgi:hypothetical protein